LVSRLKEVEREFEAVIDFSTPESTLELAREVGHSGKPMVIGTTGFTEKQKTLLVASLQGSACVLAPNMSVGVNVLFKVAGDVARTLGAGYDVEIVEVHHRFKADAPSGTALRLAEGIARARGIPLAEKARYGREGKPGARDPEELGILAVRAGDVVGEHTVVFGGIGERLELVHKAHSRDNFALGALRAVKWVVTRPAGMYDMQDVLGLK
jgi:4-hydroxy-tetrahydrodipicolinate reductase